MKVRIIHNDSWKKGTVVADSELTGFPASNTQHKWLTRVWKFNNAEILTDGDFESWNTDNDLTYWTEAQSPPNSYIQKEQLDKVKGNYSVKAYSNGTYLDFSQSKLLEANTNTFYLFTFCGKGTFKYEIIATIGEVNYYLQNNGSWSQTYNSFFFSSTEWRREYKVFRSAGAVNHTFSFARSSAGTFYIDNASLKKIVFIKKQNSNLLKVVSVVHSVKDGAIVLQGNNTDEWSNPSVNLVKTGTLKQIETFFVTLNTSYIRLGFADCENTQISVARIYAGNYLTLDKIRQEFIKAKTERAVINYSHSGQLAGFRKYSLNQLAFRVILDSEVKEMLLDIFEKEGKTNELILVFNPELSTEEAHYVRFADDIEVKNLHALRYFESDLRFEELK